MARAVFMGSKPLGFSILRLLYETEPDHLAGAMIVAPLQPQRRPLA
jgi:hypothetical protein